MEEVWRDINLHTPHNSTSFRSTLLQDFLARPFAGCTSPPPSTIPPQLPNLNSQPMMAPDASFPMDVSASGFFHHPFANEMCFSKSGLETGTGGDRRHKRMIKNRESAARSRARKQAYTSELEREVAQLMEENAKLRGEQEQLRLAAASQLPKKHTQILQRTSTAPF